MQGKRTQCISKEKATGSAKAERRKLADLDEFRSLNLVVFVYRTIHVVLREERSAVTPGQAYARISRCLPVTPRQAPELIGPRLRSSAVMLVEMLGHGRLKHSVCRLARVKTPHEVHAGPCQE
jgi:hypothetical protein